MPSRGERVVAVGVVRRRRAGTRRAARARPSPRPAAARRPPARGRGGRATGGARLRGRRAGAERARAREHLAARLLEPRAVKRREDRVGLAALGAHRVEVVDREAARGAPNAAISSARRTRSMRRRANGPASALKCSSAAPDLAGQPRAARAPARRGAATSDPAEPLVEVREALEQELRARARRVAAAQQPVVEAEHRHDRSQRSSAARSAGWSCTRRSRVSQSSAVTPAAPRPHACGSRRSAAGRVARSARARAPRASIGWRVVTRKPSHGGVIASRFKASA